MTFFGRSNCDLQIPYKVDPNPWKQHQNWVAIERWASYFARNCSGGCEQEVIFSVPTTLTGSTSPPWQSTRRDLTLTRLTMLFGNVVDTQPVTVTAYQNGNAIVEVTMAAGENVVHVESADMDSAYTNFGLDGEFLTFACTDLGANEASAVTVIALFDCGGSDGTPPDPPTPV